MIDGNDGGLNISHDGGDNWRFVPNLPVGQFYHVNVDMKIPYNVYGGMQDNGSWQGPAYVWRSGGIRNAYWEELFFGDGFDVVIDKSNPRYAYAMSQQGNIGRVDRQTKNVRPQKTKNVRRVTISRVLSRFISPRPTFCISRLPFSHFTFSVSHSYISCFTSANSKFTQNSRLKTHDSFPIHS